MTLKYTKPLKILVLFFIIALLVVPAVSAQNGTDNSGKKDNNGATDDSYIITPAEESSSSNTDPVMSSTSTQSISKGGTIIHNVNVGQGVRYLELDLNWKVTSAALSTAIYSPAGYISTYTDTSDGSKNARIHVNIYPRSGSYIQSGTWKFKVYGNSVYGSVTYTFNVYSHY